MKTQIKRRIRWDRVAMLLVIILLCMSFGVQTLAVSPMPECQSVTVSSGDTLWGLIKEVNPDYRGSMERAVYQTCTLNNMKNSMICVGEILLIPNL